jgi:hypothetical protein
MSSCDSISLGNKNMQQKSKKEEKQADHFPRERKSAGKQVHLGFGGKDPRELTRDFQPIGVGQANQNCRYSHVISHIDRSEI